MAIEWLEWEAQQNGQHIRHQVSRHLVDSSFRRCNQLNEKTFELEMSKKTIRLDLPMQIEFFVYQYAKLRMLQFYYDFVDVFVDRRDFQYCANTDSAYMVLSAETLEEVIKPDLRQVYAIEKKNWFPRKRTNQKAGCKQKQPIDSIDTKSSFYKKQRQESRDSHFIRHVT
jgi:hypothetical protein